jgi:hypothetical protein
MAFTKITTTQKVFLENYLRGTGEHLTGKQAAATYGIKNLRARMSEFRKAGLNVRTEVIDTATGRKNYTVSRRDAQGKQAKLFA